MRIAHLAFDQKFIPFARDVFEEGYPGKNTWLLLHETDKPLHYIRDSGDFRLVSLRTLRSQDCLQTINDNNLLIVHAMIPAFADVVKRVSEDLTVMWIGWGYEYYSYLEQGFGDLILPETAAAWRRALAAEGSARKGVAFHLKSLLRPAYRALKAALVNQESQETIQTVAGRIDLCCVSPSEMPLLREAFPGFRATHYQLHYFSKEDTLERGPTAMVGPDILLGNSDTPENNHFESMNLLRRMGVDGRKIIVPLSYGHSHYADEVSQFGRRLFGSDFMPLRHYIPIDEYHELLATCGTVIMNHRRQAAMGNISAALYKGARVILREENPIYQTYSKLGVVLDSMHTIEQSPRGAVLPLSAEERSRNRKIVGEYMGRANLISAIRGLEAYCNPASLRQIEALRVAGHG